MGEKGGAGERGERKGKGKERGGGGGEGKERGKKGGREEGRKGEEWCDYSRQGLHRVFNNANHSNNVSLVTTY